MTTQTPTIPTSMTMAVLHALEQQHSGGCPVCDESDLVYQEMVDGNELVSCGQCGYVNSPSAFSAETVTA